MAQNGNILFSDINKNLIEDFKNKEAEKIKNAKERARNRAMYEQGTV